MITPLRCLVVDDSADHAALLVDPLRAGGFEVTAERVESPEALRAALERAPWDLVIAGHPMARFSGLDALALLRAGGHALPVIVVSGVSGPLGEDLAVEALQAGASDYLTKDQLARLAPVVRRELTHAAGRERDAATELHRALLLTSLDGYWLADAQGRLLEVSAAYARMSGYTVEELRGKPIADLECRESAADTAAHLAQLLRLGEDRFETAHRRKDGTVFDVEISAQYRPDHGGRIVCLLRDITERKLAEATHRAREAQLQFVTDHVSVCIAHLDHERRYKFVNQPYAGLFGKRPADLIGQYARDVMGEVAYAQAAPYIAAVLTGQPAEYEIDLPESPDWPGTLHLSYAPERDAAGQVVGYISAVSDVTAQKAAAVALARATELLERASELAKIGGWQVDLATMTRSWTREMFRIAELEPPLAPSTNMINMFAPEVRPTVVAAVQAAIEVGTPYDLELPLITGKGRSVWVRTQCFPELRDGRVVGLHGTFQDITAGKEAGVELARATELLERTGELAKIGGWQVDLATMKLSWTRETFRIADREPPVEPPLEQGIDLFAPEARPTIAAAVQAAIDAGTPYDLELPLITGAGRHLWVRTQGYAEWQDGKVVRIYGTFQDITAQRLAAEELREREAELVTRNAALRRFNKVAVGRELRMIELKQEVNALCARLAEPPRYGAGALATPQPPVEP